MRLRYTKPELDPTSVPSAIDIAWAAGIYEGEGTCRLCGKTKRGLTVAVVQKDPEILYRLRDWFGGKVRFARSVNVPLEQQCHMWEACGDKARILLAVVYPFLSARRRAQVDAIEGLHFLKGKNPEGMGLQQIKSELFDYYDSMGAFLPETPSQIRRREQNKQYAQKRRAARKTAHVISIA